MSQSVFLTKYLEKEGNIYESDDVFENDNINYVDVDDEIVSIIKPYFKKKIPIFNEDKVIEQDLYTPSDSDLPEIITKLVNYFCRLISEIEPETNGVLDQDILLISSNKLRRLTTTIQIFQLKIEEYSHLNNYIITIG